MCVCVCFFNFPQCNVRPGVCVAEGMRLRGRDLEDSTGSWIPSVLGVQSVRLRLRLDRRTDRGRGLWQLVDLNGEAVQSGQGLWDRTPPTCSQSKNGVITIINFIVIIIIIFRFHQMQLIQACFLFFFCFKCSEVQTFYALDQQFEIKLVCEPLSGILELFS